MIADSSKAKLRLYLGYPDGYRYKNPRLESVLDNLSPDAEEQIAGILTSLVTVEAALLKSSTTQAGLKRLDEIWFENGWRAASEVRKYGRMFVSRLSVITGVPILSDVFGTGGYMGDSFSGSGGRTGGSGGFYNVG